MDCTAIMETIPSSKMNWKPVVYEHSPGHPYGRENQVSVNQLWKFFCNNLYLGQWELARAAAKELATQKELLGINICDVLKNISDSPYGFSLGDENIPSVHQLSALSHQEYVGLGNGTADKSNLPKLQEEVGFRLLINDASQYLSPEVIQEIYIYRSKSQNTNLSKDTRVCLQSLLNSDPSLGASLLEAMVPGYEYPTELTSLYIESLYHALNQVRELEKVNASLQSSRGSRVIETLHSLLSFYRPKRMPVTTEMKEFLIDLSDTEVALPNVVKIEALYSVFLGKGNTRLLQEFCDAYFEGILKGDEVDIGSMSKDALSILSICNGKNRKRMWKNLSIHSYRQKRHFLDLIMETAMSLVKSSNFDQLSSFLSPPELQPLGPLVLLVGWDHCTDVGTARKLLRALSVTKERVGKVTVLDEACDKLAQQVNLVEWCLENSRSMGIPEDTSGPAHQMSLLKLETQSVLSMLHHSTRLHNLGHDQVLDIIRKRLSIDESDAAAMTKKDKTVRFAMDEDLAAEKPKSQKIDVGVEIDASTYLSYAAIDSFMKAMHFCADKANWEGYLSARNKQLLAVENKTKHTMKLITNRQRSLEYEYSRSNSFGKKSQVFEQMSHRGKSSSFETGTSWNSEEDSILQQLQEASFSLEHFQEQYEEQTIDLLQEGRKFISEIYPLKLRVETLENLFSLLFLTNENIREDLACLSDSGEEGAAPESRNTSRVGSRENINSQNQSLDASPCPSSAGFAHSETEFSFDGGKSPIVISPETFPEGKETEKDNESPGVNEANQPQTVTTPVGIFSITKTELKSSDPEGHIKRTSGNISTNSVGSNASVYKVGFVANPYVVRDSLMVLKECLVDLRAEKYRLIDQQAERLKPEISLTSPASSHSTPPTCPPIEEHSVNDENLLNRSFSTSIGQDELQQRMSRLSQVINEALWRFQLIVDNKLSSTLGKIDMEKSHLEIGMDSDEDKDYCEKRTRRRSHRRRNTKGESTGESDPHPTTNEDSNTSSGGKAQKAKRRHKQGALGITEEVIPLMLSDPETLLHLCLTRGRYGQAKQVVKMLGLENSNSVAEVMFSEHYSIAVKTLQNLVNKPPKRRASSTSPTSLHGGRPSLSTIANVAAAGMVTVSATTTVDQILSLNVLPSFSSEQLECIWNSASPLATYVDPAIIPAMVILDLTCVAPTIHESANNLVEMMKKRLPKQSDELTGANAGSSAGSRNHSSRMRRSKSQESVLSSESKQSSTGSEGKKSSAQHPPISGIKNLIDKISQLLCVTATRR